MRLAIASTSYEDSVQKSLIIYKANLLYIFFNSLRGWYRSAPLKYQSWKPYRAIWRIQVLYNRCLCIRESSLVELLSIFIPLIVDKALLV